MTTRDRMQAIDVATPVEQVLLRLDSSVTANVPVYRGTLDTVVGFLNTKRLLVRHVEAGRAVAARADPAGLTVTVDDRRPADRRVPRAPRASGDRARRDRQVVGMVTLDDCHRCSAARDPTPTSSRSRRCASRRRAAHEVAQP